MSQIFSRENLSFQEELRLAFRGDAGEQKKTREEFFEKRKFELGGIKAKTTLLGRLNLGAAEALRPLPGQTLPNVFKSNLGGTKR